MTDVPEIIREIAEKVGTTAEKAWPLYVQYVWAEGMTSLVLGSVTLLALLCAGIVGARWLVRKKELDSEIWFPVVMVAMVASFVATPAVIAVGNGLPRVLAPEGAAIHEVVGKVMR